MKERIIKFGINSLIVGILSGENSTHNNTEHCIIFLNAGIIHKIGPNRIYVKIAREMARKGIMSLRFDYSGVGDSPIYSSSNHLNEIQQAMDKLQTEIGIMHFTLLGICSGAKDAFKVSNIDQRITRLILIDGVYQEDNELNDIYPQALRNCAVRYYKKHLFNLKRWGKLIKGESHALSKSNFIEVKKIILSKVKKIATIWLPKKNMESKDQTNVLNDVLFKWKKLLDRKIKIFLMFCDGSPSIDIFNLTLAKELTDYKASSLLHLKRLKNVDHTFTPIWSQEYLIEEIMKIFS